MNVISTSKSRELAELANRLPRVIKRTNDGEKMLGVGVEWVDGSRLLAAGIKDHYGRIVEAGQKYRMRVPLYEDHRLNLIHNYQRDGDKGVKAYTRIMIHRSWNDLPLRLKLKGIFKMIKSTIGKFTQSVTQFKTKSNGKVRNNSR